jgi:hypothetical protein
MSRVRLSLATAGWAVRVELGLCAFDDFYVTSLKPDHSLVRPYAVVVMLMFDRAGWAPSSEETVDSGAYDADSRGK